MHIVLAILGIALSFCMLKWREAIGNMMGEATWMSKVGGVYNVVILIAIFIFFWSLAELTNTTQFLFAPLRFLIPGVDHSGGAQVEGF
jgi:hypothetical protein